MLLAGLLIAGVVLALMGGSSPVPDDAPTLDEMGDAVGAEMMERISRGHVPGRSGEIVLLPEPHNFVRGPWDLRTLYTAEPEIDTAHSYAWDYLARVPFVFYGPRYFEPAERNEKLDVGAFAPIYADLMGLEGLTFDSPSPFEGRRSRKAPKVIFTVVIDGGGWNVLMEHPNSWPTIAELMDQGTNYVNASIGLFPTITGAVHATMGTGVYPREHGIPGNQMRGPGGDPTIDAWNDNADPQFLRTPTVSEIWDAQNDNEPIVGTVSYEGWHLGMIGHGAQLPGHDKDIGVLWRNTENEWWINEDYYTLPEYLQETDLGRLESHERDLDPRDGISDGLWFGHTLEEIVDVKKRPGTPAFARFTGDAVMSILQNEPIGKDRVTDLFWVEMKQPDFGGHLWGMGGPEQADTMWEVDRQIARYKRWLDENVPGEYVLAISADHGQQPLPEQVDGWRIDSEELEADIRDAFGADVIQKITPIDVFIDTARARSEDIELADIARFIGRYTLGDNLPEDAPGIDRVPEARLDELLFAGVFPSDYVTSLTPEEIEAFGETDFPEGGLNIGELGD